MNILIADDEPLAIARLAQLLKELDGKYDAVATANNGQEAIQQCQENEIDLVLMDIRMPGMDGIDAALSLQKLTRPPAVIFTTAFEEHALDAFKTNAVDYLLKPIKKNDLLAALKKASALTRVQLDEMKAPEQYISASYRGGIRRFPLEDVIFLHAESKYVVLRHAEGEALIEDSLTSLEQKFEGHFLRIHRNALVDRNKIMALNKTNNGQMFVNFVGIDDQLEVSRRHMAAIRTLLKS